MAPDPHLCSRIDPNDPSYNDDDFDEIDTAAIRTMLLILAIILFLVIIL